MGDSAGGNFALIVAQQAKKQKIRTADNVVLICPCISMIMPNASLLDKYLKNEVILTKDFLNAVLKWQLKNGNTKDPL
jgi:acetyl esterase/lipase